MTARLDKWAEIAAARAQDPAVIAARAAYDAEQAEKRAKKRAEKRQNEKEAER